LSKIQEALKRIQGTQPKTGSATEQRDDTANVEKVSSLENTGVLGQLSQVEGERALRDFPDEGGLVLVHRDALRSEGYLAPHDQERSMADQYRLIKRPLLDNASGKGAILSDDANLIMVTSALPGDGKTFTCINLALSMAMEKDTSVLLVDADVAKPHVSDLFGVSDQPGLIELLKHKDRKATEFVLRTDIPGLRLLPAGTPDENATELLASRRMKRITAELSASYPDHVIIFDSPPLLVTSEARVLASAVGQIAMVVRAGKTPQKAVTDAIESLDKSKAANLILNEADAAFNSTIYSGYGYGYGHAALKS
jgi:protein-tyrosine kinase